MNSNYNKEQLASNCETLLTLEWFGIRFEDTKEERDSFGFVDKINYYYSVPESSTIELEDKELNDKIKTANGLKYLAKEEIIDMMINSFKAEFGEDEEIISDVRNNPSKHFKFYAKVRVGEIWNKELGDKRIKELIDDMKNASGYKEI